MSYTSEEIFIEQSIRYMHMSIERIAKCLDQINSEELWYSPNQHTNSIGNLVIHLAGNINQYINSGLGGSIDSRDRDSEFIPNQASSISEVLKVLDEVYKKAVDIITKIGPSVLTKDYVLQGFKMTGMEAILHVTEHLSYHTGQIALLTKILKKEDLGFYSGKNLNKRNT